MARTINTLLEQYRSSHRHPNNEMIHFVCVPLIMYTLLGLLWAVHPLAALAALATDVGLLRQGKRGMTTLAGARMSAWSASATTNTVARTT